MKINIVKKIGKSTLTFEVEGDKELEALIRAALCTSMPDACGLCGSENVQLISNKADKYSYAKVQCLRCKATSTMGQYQDGVSGFWKAFEIYQKDAPAQTK